MVDAYTSMRVRLLPPFSWMHTDISLSLIGKGLISWAASQLAKPTPAVLSSPPPQKIVWLFSIIFPAAGHWTSQEVSMLAFSNSQQIRAVARSGHIEVSLSLVVQTFQAPRFRCCLFELESMGYVCVRAGTQRSTFKGNAEGENRV